MNEESFGPSLAYNRVDRNFHQTLLLSLLLAIVVVLQLACLFIFLAVTLSALVVVNEFFSHHILGATFSKIFAQKENLIFWSALPALISLGLALVFIIFLHTRLAGYFFLRAVQAIPIRPGQESELWQTLESLCVGSGLPPPRLYLQETQAANAFVTGLSPNQASVVVTRGLLNLLDHRELEGIVAHELSRIGNYDIRLNTILAAVVWVLRLPKLILTNLLFKTEEFGEAVVLFILFILFAITFLVILIVIATMKLLIPLFSLFLYLALPIIIIFCGPRLGLAIQRKFSRERVFLADADAILLTRYPPGLTQALQKLREGLCAIQVSTATAHFYLVDPLERGGSFASTHPPVEERVAFMEKISRMIPSSKVGEHFPAPAQQKAEIRDNKLDNTYPESNGEPTKPIKYIFILFGALCGVLLALFVESRIALIGWVLFIIISFGMYWLWVNRNKT